MAVLAGLFLLDPRLGGAAGANTDTGNQWSGWDPGTVVEINLQRGRIVDALPFDVPFFLLSKPPEPLLPKFDPVAFLASRSRLDNCNKSPLATQNCGPYPTDVCKVPVAKVKEKVNKTGEPVDQIEISMPPLRPRQDYCFAVAMPRQPTRAEKLLMQKAARDYLDRAVKAADSRETVLTKEWLESQCAQIKTSIESAVVAQGLTVIPSEGSAMLECQASAVNELYEKLVSNVSIANLKTSLDSADAVLVGLRDAVPEDEADPRLKEIRSLGGLEDRLQYLGLPSQLPSLISKEQVDKWIVDLKAIQDDLVKGWTTRQADVAAICRDEAMTLAAAPLMRMRCFAASEVEGVLLEMRSVVANLAAGDDVDNLAVTVAPKIVESLAVGATTWDGFEQRFRWYVSADMGFAHAWDIDESFAYVGVNFYGSPVNKKAPLNGFGRERFLGQRLALVIGLPTPKLEDPSRKPLVAGKPVLVGAGMRLTDYLRLTVGGLFFNEADPNPLVDDTRGLKATPFASLSLDVDVAGIFTSFFAPR